MNAKWDNDARAYGDCEMCGGSGDADQTAKDVVCKTCLERRIAELETGLRWYANPDNYEMVPGSAIVPIEDDNGDYARQVLGIESE